MKRTSSQTAVRDYGRLSPQRIERSLKTITCCSRDTEKYASRVLAAAQTPGSSKQATSVRSI